MYIMITDVWRESADKKVGHGQKVHIDNNRSKWCVIPQASHIGGTDNRVAWVAAMKLNKYISLALKHDESWRHQIGLQLITCHFDVV